MQIIQTIFCVLFPIAVFAQQNDGAKSTGMFGSVLPMMVLMFVIIYFLMIRPEQKKQKQRQKMINEMKKGDKALTVGGMYGIIHNVKGDVISLKIAEDTVVEVTKAAVSSVIAKDSNSDEGTVKEKK